MPFPVFLLILASVTISSLAQITLKHGMSFPLTQAALQNGGLNGVITIGSNIFVLGGLALYALGAFVWLGVLAKIDVSVAYPCVAIGFVLTTIMAAVFLGEGVGLTRLGGTILIALGVVLVARS